LKKYLLAATAASLLGAAPARANDTMAELKTGGLVFVRSDAVEMESEDLYISEDEVRVDYVFRNTGGADVESIVAFPMPEIEGNPWSDVAIPDREADNMFQFTIEVDGKPFEPELERKAYAVGLDVTELLRQHNVPLNPFAEATVEAVTKLPEAVKQDWLARGMLVRESWDAGEGMQEHDVPVWSLRATYWWRAKFPRGERISVRHRYQPSVGGTVAVTFMEDGKATGESLTEYRDKYCVDDAFLKSVERRAAENPDKVAPFYENWISYVLTTGANWAGPIKKFRLVIDKGAAENLVSFCGTGVRKTGETTFEMTAEDFYPQQDINVLLLKKIEQ